MTDRSTPDPDGLLHAARAAMARRMADTLRGEPGLEVLGPVGLTRLKVRFGAGAPAVVRDRLTLAAIARGQEEGVASMGPAQWRGIWGMRVAASSTETRATAGDESVASVVRSWKAVR